MQENELILFFQKNFQVFIKILKYALLLFCLYDSLRYINILNMILTIILLANILSENQLIFETLILYNLALFVLRKICQFNFFKYSFKNLD